MAHRFIVPDSPASEAPSTPDRKYGGSMRFGDNPSTTPAGPPPGSSVASFTPAGAPTDSFLGSSMMRGTTASGKSFGFGGTSTNPSGRTLFDRSSPSAAPLGRSIRGRNKGPSALSQQYNIDEDAEGEDVDAEGDYDLPAPRASLFRTSMAPNNGQDQDDGDSMDNAMEAEIEKYISQEMDMEQDDFQHIMHDEGQQNEEDAGSEVGDMFLNMRHDDRPYGQPIIGDESDLMVLNTPAATDRVRREAEDIFKQSSRRFGNSTKGQSFQFATIAKDLYSSHDVARLTEPNQLILKTEDLVCRLYNEGVGTEDDAEKMDNSLANIASSLATLWNDYVEELPQPEGEDDATIGPSAQAEPFEKAAYIANLVLRMHHTRGESSFEAEQAPPLPQVLFEWMDSSHNLYPDQLREINRYKPSPACHQMFWLTLRNALLRGDVRGASQLLRNAGWEHVRKSARGDKAYTGLALENVRRFAEVTCDMLDQCPGASGDWDIWNSAWTLFRVSAQGALDRLALFAEGRGEQFDESMGLGDGFSGRGPSMSNLARKASSQIPWDIYENLQLTYGIVLGDEKSILGTAQDWCEATVGLFGWWNDSSRRNQLRLSRSRNNNFSSSRLGASEDYLRRLSTAFHRVIQSDLNPNIMNPVEVAIASAFEGNINAVIGILRTWSLPVACSVAEVAALGDWLPPPEVMTTVPSESLDMDDLALLGIAGPSPDEKEGIKDTTLVLYARELAGIDAISPQRDGWEIAIEVLGRMDLPEKSEETVGELLRDLLATLDQDSSKTVNKMWHILNELGMIAFAEETAETFADILAKESHRFGEALWYFALAHRPGKVREVLNLLTAYSLIQSTPYPAENELDADLKNLLRKRSETLEIRAEQDLEAAQLLGRMLAGYATLRKFYELRDQYSEGGMSSGKALALKREAMGALVAVIASSNDNIRGGLYDEARDAVVSEDFLLALLGEATYFISQSPAVVSLDQMDVILKAVEDLQTVGSRVYDSCDDFFNHVLGAGKGLKGSTPADLMRKSTAGAGMGGSSYVMTGSSLLVSQVNKAMASSGSVERGWDWRKAWQASTKGEDVLRKLRFGLADDLAALWLAEADGLTVY